MLQGVVVYMCVRVYVYVCICIRASVYVYVRVSMYTCVYIPMHTHTQCTPPTPHRQAVEAAGGRDAWSSLLQQANGSTEEAAAAACSECADVLGLRYDDTLGENYIVHTMVCVAATPDHPQQRPPTNTLPQQHTQ